MKNKTLNWVTTTNNNEEIVGNILNISGYTSYFFKNMPKLVHDKLKQKCIKLTKYAKFHSGQWRFEKKKEENKLGKAVKRQCQVEAS